MAKQTDHSSAGKAPAPHAAACAAPVDAAPTVAAEVVADLWKRVRKALGEAEGALAAAIEHRDYETAATMCREFRYTSVLFLDHWRRTQAPPDDLKARMDHALKAGLAHLKGLRLPDAAQQAYIDAYAGSMTMRVEMFTLASESGIERMDEEFKQRYMSGEPKPAAATGADH